jgi:hypothetical protein
MINLTYKTDKSYQKIIHDAEVKDKKIIAEILKSGQETPDKMKSFIKDAKKRPQAGEPARLENAIDMELILEGKNIIGWGVGNIERLNREAPHWHFVNFGVSQNGMVIPGRGKIVPVGGFSPGEPRPNPESFQEGRWQVGGGNYVFQATQGIREPLNYIERTVNWVGTTIMKILSIVRI